MLLLNLHVYMAHYMVYILIVSLLFIQLNGQTALHLAAAEGEVDVVRLLIEAEAEVDTQTKVNVYFLCTDMYGRKLLTGPCYVRE